MATASTTRRVWWATWPGALALGLASLAMVVVTALSLILVALLTPPGSSETYGAFLSGPSYARLVTWLLLGIACFALPPAVVVVARRAWLGWVLVLLALSAFVLAAGLWSLDIL